MMKQLALLLAFLSFVGCAQQDQCAKDAAVIDAKWADIHPTSKEDVRAEINDLMADNTCGTITPWRVRKVMNDILAARQCRSPEIKAKIASYRQNDSGLLREISGDIADCPTPP